MNDFLKGLFGGLYTTPVVEVASNPQTRQEFVDNAEQGFVDNFTFSSVRQEAVNTGEKIIKDTWGIWLLVAILAAVGLFLYFGGAASLARKGTRIFAG